MLRREFDAKKGPERDPSHIGGFRNSTSTLHAGVGSGRGRSRLLFLGTLGNHALRGEQQ